MSDTMSMREQIARVLAFRSWVDQSCDADKRRGSAPFVDNWWPHYLSAADDALEAMREPTEAMITAGWRGLNRRVCEDGDRSAFVRFWQGMIDAALTEDHKGGPTTIKFPPKGMPEEDSERQHIEALADEAAARGEITLAIALRHGSEAVTSAYAAGQRAGEAAELRDALQAFLAEADAGHITVETDRRARAVLAKTRGAQS